MPTEITINGINKQFNSHEEIITELKKKTVVVPSWAELEKEYNPKKHPVFTDPNYKDKTNKGVVTKVTRIGIGLQRLATRRMSQLMFGIPVKRIYKVDKENQKSVEAAKLIEKIIKRNRIDAVNFERAEMLFAGCEFVTLWHAIEEKTSIYGVDSNIKIRCRNYSPMQGDELYPYFDRNDDLKALSFAYSENSEGSKRKFFETYTAEKHYLWENKTDGWDLIEEHENKLGKIPAVYLNRQAPIWEDTSNNVYEIEWTISRNGNYIRKNNKPLFGIFADEQINGMNSGENDDLAVYQFPKGSDAKYISWEQSTESLKIQLENLYRAFFTELQLPDMSFDQMKAIPMSGEARKMMFIDAHLKVTQEAGRWIEILDREIQVVKEFAKVILPNNKKEIDQMEVEIEITPFQINDEGEQIANLMAATGGKQIISQREGITYLGWSENPDKTLDEIKEESNRDIFEPTF